MNEFEMYECLTRFREPLIRKMTGSLGLTPGSKGIDIGCGIGRITCLLAGEKDNLRQVTGLDISGDLIGYAKKNVQQENITFIRGDVNQLQFPPGSFDWIWSMDALWPGGEELGCPVQSPGVVLDRLHQLLKPGGNIFLAYWSSQKLLPGHPLLEARLNASVAANSPYLEGMDPDTHVLFGQKWLRKANFGTIEAKTFTGDISGPLDENDKTALTELFRMLWGNSESEVSRDDWIRFNALCTPSATEFILNDPDYYGFYTYTLFTGTKEK